MYSEQLFNMKKKLYITASGRVNTNCYIMVDEVNNNCIIVDLPDETGEQLAEFCQQNGITPLAILLTHGHFDHCGGVAEFLREFNVPVYGHANDIELAKNASKNKWRVRAEDCDITNFVNDGETITIGDFIIEVMHTPGHTMGSVCYFIEDLMFSGDTLFHTDIGRTDFAESNPAEMYKSLKKIAKIEKDYKVLPGHEEYTTLKEEQENNVYLR